MAGLVSVAAGVSVVDVFFFLEKRAFSLSKDSGSKLCVSSDHAMSVLGFNHTTHVDEGKRNCSYLMFACAGGD